MTGRDPQDDPQPDADRQGVSSPEPAEGAPDKPEGGEGSPEG